MGGSVGSFLSNPVGSVKGLLGDTGGGEGGVYFDPGAKPERPKYQSIADPNHPGQLLSGYELKPGQDVSVDQTGYNAIKDQATAAPGTSAWGNLMRQQNQQNLTNQQNNLTQQSDNALAQAQSSLAQQRGLSAGASNRLATNAMRDRLAGQQGLANQFNQQNLNIGTQEAQNQMNAQNTLANQALANANFQQGQRAFDDSNQQFNIRNAIAEHQNENNQNLSAYQAQLGQWAAANQSNAMSAANNRGKK